MDFEEIKKIYGRLGQIEVKMEPKTIPNPRYISEKIGQCHVCIEEVEKYYIQISMEMSILQRALNNAEAGYNVARDELLSTEPIASLPSTQAREARANSQLKDQLTDIKNHKSHLSDLEKIFSTINVKLKNLNRTNSDIKVQLRLMESQIKLGTGGVGDPVEKNLMDELKNTVLGVDILEGADTQIQENSTIDPSSPIGPDIFEKDTENDFAFLENSINQMLAKKINDVPIPEPETTTQATVPELSCSSNATLTDINNPLILDINNVPISGNDTIINLSDPSFFNEVINNPVISNSKNVTTQTRQNDEVVDLNISLIEDSGGIPVPPIEPPVIPITPVDELEQPEDYFNGYVKKSEETFPEDDLLGSVEPSKDVEPVLVAAGIDLDKVLSPAAPEKVAEPIGGVAIQEEIRPIIESQPKGTLQEEPKNLNEIDFTALLSQFN